MGIDSRSGKATAFEVPTRVVNVDAARFPDRDARYVRAYLTEYYRLEERMPAIQCVVDEGRLVVVDGHKYLNVAVDTGRDRVTIVILGSGVLRCRRTDPRLAGIA